MDSSGPRRASARHQPGIAGNADLLLLPHAISLNRSTPKQFPVKRKKGPPAVKDVMLNQRCKFRQVVKWNHRIQMMDGMVIDVPHKELDEGVGFHGAGVTVRATIVFNRIMFVLRKEQSGRGSENENGNPIGGDQKPGTDNSRRTERAGPCEEYQRHNAPIPDQGNAFENLGWMTEKRLESESPVHQIDRLQNCDAREDTANIIRSVSVAP